MKTHPLTTQQQNIWNLQKFYPDTAISNQCGAVIYDGELDTDRLAEAIRAVIGRQSGLRLRFTEQDGARQYVSDGGQIDIPVLEFSDRKELDAYGRRLADRPMPLEDAPMYRFAIAKVGTQTAILALLNHLISDAWTFSLIARQVSETYHQGGGQENTAPATGDYLAYAADEEAYLSSPRFQKDRAYWEEKYATGLEESGIRPTAPKNGSAEAERKTVSIGRELSERMRSFCKRNAVTESVLFEGAVVLYLSRIRPDNSSVTIGSFVLNRNGVRQKNTAGMFISTMPLTVACHGEMTVRELLEQIGTAHRELFRHQRYPYPAILKYLRGRQNLAGNPYEVIVSYQNAAVGNGTETVWYPNGYNEVPLSLHIDHRDGKGTFRLTADYQKAAFGGGQEIDYLVKRLLSVIRQMETEPDRAIKNIGIVCKDERPLLLGAFNATHIDYPKDKCVHELFTEQAARTPDRTALIYEEKAFTYRQLDELSNSLAHFLREQGVGRNEVVPVFGKRSWRTIVAMLAIMKSGGAFLSLSVDYPEERIRYILENTNARIVLGDERAFPFDDKEYIDLEKFDFSRNVHAVSNVNESGDLCYVVYTSGSTGNPKGLCIAHRNGVNFCNENEWNVRKKIVGKDQNVFLSITNTIFDMFITELFIPLTSGMTLLLADEEECVSADRLNRLCEKYPPDVIESTPSKLNMLLGTSEECRYLSGVKSVIVGGEALTDSFFRLLRTKTDAGIFNNYGPAETTVWSTIAKVEMAEDITIGRPIANTQIYILDEKQRLLPLGVAGELCIAGDGVGKGYLNQPGLTEERFIANPFATEENGHGKILYRTGDLARWRADGNLEYLGRIDTQVKVRGLRIELGEIESVMAEMDGMILTAAAVQTDESGRQYLVGYYTAKSEIDETALREHLSSKLPHYMVPNFFMRLPEMPMTASGKTDRKNLPDPDLSAVGQEYAAPQTEPERTLCGILAEVLSAERVGVTDNFFQMGGDSLAAITYVAMAREKDIHIALQDVFDFPTVRQICGRLGGTKRAGEAGIPEDTDLWGSGYEHYAELLRADVEDDGFSFEKQELGNVLLTGATGFLGAHILDALLTEENGAVYCLVRGNGNQSAEERLKTALRYYFGDRYDKQIGKRIIPIAEDMTQRNISGSLPLDVQTVIHAAASVKHYGPYEHFRTVNTDATRHMADYAVKLAAKFIYISTISVSGNSMADASEADRPGLELDFDETMFYAGQPLENVYVRSKFEAERAVMDRILGSALDAKIIRVGNLTNRTADFKFQRNYKENAFLNRFKAIVELGLFPDYLMDSYAEFSPVDQTAAGVVKIAQYADIQTVFHLNSDKPLRFRRLFEILKEMDISMKAVDGKAFSEALKCTLQENGREHIFKALQNDLDENGKLVYESNIHIKNDFTVWFLKQVGFEWGMIDEDYVRGYVEYFRKLGYLNV